MRPRALVAALVALALSLGVMSYAGAAPDDGQKATESTGAAREALSDARSALDGDISALEGRDATLVLRDLMQARSDLTSADRRTADRLLARPTDGGADPWPGIKYDVGEAPPVCDHDVCLHYVTTTPDAPPLADGPDSNSTPDYVDLVLATTQGVHDRYIAAGYREPAPDGATGGDVDKTDIYLADMPSGLYGYCVPESEVSPTGWDRTAYCVLDDNYSPGEFPTNTPTENMQVTAAHEYFHAVQFAYDAAEDGWFMEGTATWAEDELFDEVDDSRNYLGYSQLGRPRVSLDDARGLQVYGNWIFFRYLTEKYSTTEGDLPTLIRDMWRRADGSAGAADQHSIQAVKNTIKANGGDLAKAYASFADANRRPGATYEEGRELRYPKPPLAFRPIALTPSRPGSDWKRLTLDHLTNGSARFKPKGMTQKSWQLKVRVDMARRHRGSAAVATVSFTDGSARTYRLKLDRDGDGSKRVPFSNRSVKWVDLTLVNTSARMACWQGRPFSCQGTPKDDNLVQKMRGVASR